MKIIESSSPFLTKTNFLSNQLIRHILYWFGLTIGFALIWATHDNDFLRSFTIQFFALPARMILVYTTLYILIPFLLLKKRFVFFILCYTILLIFITICIQRPIMLYYVQPRYLSDWVSNGYFNVIELMNTLLDINHAIVIPLVVVFVKFYYSEQKKALVLEKEKFKTELVQLRNQIHPHFLFNTLNSLYSLIIKKSDVAESAVVKLSGLMRYMIYEANAPRVKLSEEINYLQNYVDLEKLRFDKGAGIIFNAIKDKEYEIAPFVLIPFIENAFKHSPNSKKCKITIQLTADKGNLNLTIVNEKRVSKDQNTTVCSGIGLNNVKKRLELLYKGKYSLVKSDAGMSYEVVLGLNLI